jgi:hypothetical protein
MSKLTAYAALARSGLRFDDLALVVDVHDVSMAASGTDKKLTVGALRPGNTFWLDDYGADPTGAALSDTAWTAAYAAATAALQTHGGAMVVLGCGQYRFSVNTVSVTDSRIGLAGQGRVATTIYTTGSSGVLVSCTGATANSSQGAAPVSGFNAYGGLAGAGVAGVLYGDRLNGCLTDVSASLFGGAGGRGFWFRDNTALSEGSFIVVSADNSTVCFDFDQVTPQAAGGSFDYSHIYLHLGLSTAGSGVSSTGLRFQNGMHCFGSSLQMSGNVRASTGLTATVIQVGNSITDVSHISDTNLNVVVEADPGAGTVNDVLIQGADAFKGIIKCHGQIAFPPFGGTVTAGTITSPAKILMWGYFNSPVFSSHGTLTAIGALGTGLAEYSG